MKRLLLLLAVLVAFTFTAIGQDASQAGGAHGTTTTSTTKKPEKKAGPDEPSKHGHEIGTHEGTSGKGSTLTGCVSSSPNSEGMYTLSNGRYKNGVEVGPPDKMKDHAGHQVAVTGKWGTGAEAGESNATSAKEKGERHFQVDSVKHISETCSTASTTGSKMKKGGKSDSKTSSSATPPQTR